MKKKMATTRNKSTPPRFDVKSSRPLAEAVIAGPFDTEAEAQMYATQYGLEFEKWKKAKQAEVDSLPDDLDRAVAQRDLDKYLADYDTTFEVVAHRPGGIK